VIYVGIDWAEAHHDVCVVGENGEILLKRRIADGLDGVEQLHAALAAHTAIAGEVVIGIETDRGLLVQALVAGGYQIYAINPFALSRYRERHVSSGAKSDATDATCPRTAPTRPGTVHARRCRSSSIPSKR